MRYTHQFFGVVVAACLFSSTAAAQLVRLDFFSQGQGTQPDVEFSVTLDGNTGTLGSYGPYPLFDDDISAHGTLRVGGTTVLDATGLTSPSIGADEGITFLEIDAFGVQADFEGRGGDGPYNGEVIPGPWPTTPSQVYLVVDPGVYNPEAFEPYFVPSFIRYGTTEVPLTQLTVTILPEPSALMLGLTSVGLLNLRRRRTS